MNARARSRARLGVRLEHDGLLGREQRPVAERRARAGGVLDRHEVGMRAGRAVARELEHAGPRAARTRGAPARGVARVERVEVLAHRRERLAVVVAAALHGRRVADADAQHEAARVGLLEGGGACAIAIASRA